MSATNLSFSAPSGSQGTSLESRLAASAATALQHGRWAEALPLAERLAMLPGEDVRATAICAEALIGLHRWPEAEAAADRLIAAADSASARQLRARIRLHRSATLAAVDDAAAAVMATPDDRGAKGLLGECLLQAEHWDDALYFLGEAAASGDPPALLRLAHGFALADRSEAASELLAHLAATCLGLEGLAEVRAHAALLAGDPAQAAQLAEAALAREGPTALLLLLLGHALLAQGQDATAAPHLAAATRLAPEDAHTARLAASVGAAAPAGLTEAALALQYDRDAAGYDACLGQRGDRVPGLIARAVGRLLPSVASGSQRLGPTLDLGCGTGLAGVVLHEWLEPMPRRVLVGVDLSAGMLAEAAGKALYTELREDELTRVLAADLATYALIIAADVFCHLGPLDVVFGLSRARLRPEGFLLFSMQQAAARSPGWQLGRDGRYSHQDDYVRDALAAAGLEIVLWQDESLRHGPVVPMPGRIVAARAVAAH